MPTRLYDWTLWPSLGLLPAPIREAYGVRWGPVERAISAWLATAWRAWNPILPASFRQMPQALAAERRIAAVLATVPGGLPGPETVAQ